jgi:penicillin-binding protein
VKAVLNDSGTGVIISWDANPSQDQVTEYEIQYSLQSNGPFLKIATTDSTSYEYISFPINGWYRVVAINAKGSSSPSKSVYIE